VSAGAQVAPGWSLRSAEPGDREFLCRVYASTRLAELAVTGWPDDVKLAFLRSQFEAQDRHYRAAHPSARFDVILADGEPAGRLYVVRSPERIHIIDIALLPGHRNRGLGSAILQTLLAEADAHRWRVSIHVEQENRARGFYERLGFQSLEQRGLYLLMEWRPPLPGDRIR
jgi:ribosomal protein S18 acetylase RimI-like enzyme